MRMKSGSIGWGKSGASNKAKNTIIRRKKHKVHTKHTKENTSATLKESYTAQHISIGNYSGLDVVN